MYLALHSKAVKTLTTPDRGARSYRRWSYTLNGLVRGPDCKCVLVTDLYVASIAKRFPLVL